MDDIPWLYVAMIFIAFISWVHNRIQEAKEYRRARKIEKEKAARARRAGAPPEFNSPYRDQPVPEDVEEIEQPKTFREVFQELERQFADPDFEEPSAEQRPTPPPLPDDPAVFSPADIPDKPIEVAPPMKTAKRSRSSRSTRSNLVDTLQNGGSLKTALILKEVLDKPRALRSR